MGETYVIATVQGPAGVREVRLLVDSGAIYSLLPLDVWRGIGLEARRTQVFDLADGTEFERAVSECYMEIPQGGTTTPVILGESGDAALLGLVTLEELGLALHPLSRTLRKRLMRL